MPEPADNASHTPRAPSNSLISRKLKIGAAISGALLLALTAFTLWSQWGDYMVATRALASLQTFQAALMAMEKVSAERAPTNAALGDAPPLPAADAEALRTARQQTDLALDQLAGRLDPAACRSCFAELAATKHIRNDLSSARRQIDLLTSLPLDARDAPQLDEAVGDMIAIVPQFTEILNASQARIADGNAPGLDFLNMARFAAMLRENAGLLGSRFTVSLAARRPLSQSEQLNVENAAGHVDQLRLSIEALAASNPSLNGDALNSIREQYFGHALSYVHYVRSFTERSAQQLPTTAEFAAQYVPLMSPIVGFRDEMVRRATSELLRHRNRARLRFLLAALLGVILIALQSLLIWLFRRNVIAPFAEATFAIVSIAADSLPETVQSRPYPGEVQSLFNALNVLKLHSRQRLGLLAELRRQSETDPLTSLLNRRSFEARAHVLCSIRDEDRPWLALIMFDIDHFKHINDTWGHATGDTALKTIADLCRRNWRSEDIVARVGGEEFAVLIATHNPEESVRTVERFRETIAATTLHSADGQPFSFTVSFGIAFDRHEHCPEIPVLLARADEQLYRAKEGGRNRVEVEPVAPGLQAS